MPLYHWIEQPFVGLERTEDPSQTKEEVFHTTEIMPQFPGGDAELLKYIRDNMRYPQAALENNIQGRVIVQFVVGKDGNVTNVQVLKQRTGAERRRSSLRPGGRSCDRVDAKMDPW